MTPDEHGRGVEPGDRSEGHAEEIQPIAAWEGYNLDIFHAVLDG